MAEPLPILIVGAGPAGATLAYTLAARGVAVTLLERQHDFAREFRGEGLMPSGVEALGQCGLGELLREVPHSEPDAIALYRDGKLALEARVSDVLPAGGARPLIVSQPHLLEAIVARASEQQRFTFLRGAAVRDLLRGARGRVCGVRAEHGGGSRELEARLVIGADGRASAVRRRGGFAVREIGAPLDVVWTKLPWPECFGSAPAVRAYVGNGHLLLAIPAPDGLLQIAWVIRKGSFGALRSRGAEEWVREMAAHVSPDLAEHLRARAGEITRPFLLDAETDRVLGWAKPGVLLIGDAAHTMSPVGAQGLNLALRDAVVAANQLVPPLLAGAGDAELDAAAARIEPERGPEIDAIQAFAQRPPRIVMGSFRGAELVRAAVIALLGSPLGRFAARRLGGQLLGGVREVKLAV
jgi:2-polyprenyl-6-methoxyphenol hydroxylase-like FAD-dependent oxidoreductase